MIFSLGAIPSDEQIRLTPSMTNKKGWFISYLYFTEQAVAGLCFLINKCKLLNSYVVTAACKDV